MKQILKTKVFYWLLPVLAVIMSTSCSPDDNNDYSVLIVGTWNLTGVNAGGTDVPFLSLIGNATFTFHSDGTFEYQSTGVGSSSSKVSETGTYTLSGKSLVLNEPSAVMHWNITSITKNQMILVETDNSPEQTWTFTRVN